MTTLYINMDVLETATQHINTHNTEIDDCITQNEVVDYMLEAWYQQDYLSPIMYKGLQIIPQTLQVGEDLCIIAHIAVSLTFDLKDTSESIQAYDLGVLHPIDEEGDLIEPRD